MPKKKSSIKTTTKKAESPSTKTIKKETVGLTETKTVKLEEAKPQPKPKAAKSENNCLNCRWKKRVSDTGTCPAIGKKVDLKKPVYDCEKFRKNGGFYY